VSRIDDGGTVIPPKRHLEREVGPHLFAFVGKNKKQRRCCHCGLVQDWKFQGRRSGWHWTPAMTTCPRPVMVECDECGGCGKTQAICENCNTLLTTANQSKEDPEALCASCEEEEDVPHPYGGYAHMGCRCKGCVV